MKVIRGVEEMREWSREIHRQGGLIGFVPTMGYLHEGHLSLVRLVKERVSATVVSLFVNPIQFRPGEDFERYPRNESRDIELLDKEGVQVVFSPSVGEMYPEGFSTYIEVTQLQDPLCGRFRPGHFRGVATIVAKLFNIVECDIAAFGLKDYQQAMIIRRMVKDLNMPVTIVLGPTIREEDGLAMSSRNQYLNPEERLRARAIPQALERARRLALDGSISPRRLVYQVRRWLLESGVDQIQYVAVVHPEKLHTIESISPYALLAVAVYIGSTRLIDNVLIGPEGEKNPICFIDEDY
ncbi:MAG: pantoate--beta-alanine ligase [bacterium]